jgi:diaminopimelate decarboxylase
MKTILKTPLHYKKNNLYFDNFKLADLASSRPTPFYLYSKKTLHHFYDSFKNEAILNKINDPLICYAVKANANKEVLKELKKRGAGADVVSGGELKLAISAGISPLKIVFSGVGKTKDEINYALNTHSHGIYSFNVESIEELAMINECAKKLKKIARVAFRLNPEVNVKTHKHISTGNKTHKFGILKNDIEKAIKTKSFWTNTVLVGISIHIGSQLTEMNATKKAICELSKFVLEQDLDLEFLDIGGGLGIDYTPDDQNKLTSISLYMKAVSEALYKFYFNKTTKKPRIVFEPGRILVGKMGVLVSKVIRTKTSDGRHFTIIDAGMNDLIRPALYEAYHEVYPMSKSGKIIKTDIVGPICETSDCFGEGRKIPSLRADDYVVIDNAGAYGHTMASRYNEREIPKEYFI